jgi:1-acyl-sn-glycerol-3-phosphate acyltransferase
LLAIIRIILITVALIIISVLACFISLFRLRSRNNVYYTAKYMGKVSKLLGLTVEIRVPDNVKDLGPVVYVANHQSGWDIFTISGAVQRNTVSVGKKSLKWIPFFGQMYWLTGNILIDRTNTNKAMGTIEQTVKKIKERAFSVWLFPEGTRSKGRGLLRFKTGAFRTAQQAGVPIVPICSSNLHDQVKLNRWNNGKYIIEFLPPTYFTEENKDNIRGVANDVHAQMAEKIHLLSIEAGTLLPHEKTPEQKVAEKTHQSENK